MRGLTQRQKAFADEYIKNGGNATAAAKRAGYSEKTAYRTGADNLKHPQIASYIAERQDAIEKQEGRDIMSLADIQERRSKIAKGEIKDSIGFTADFSDQLKAMNDLEKALRIKEKEEEKKRMAEEALKAKTYHMDLDMIPDNFHWVIRDIRNRKHQEYIFRGGRGSTKSSSIAMMIVELIRNNHDIHACVCRQVGNTIKDSVYAKIKWAIGKQEFTEEFDAKKSPMEITLKATGQKIYFRGADDPDKIKSITPEFGYIGILWLEELDQFKGREPVRKIEQSAIRGGELAWIFKSFNPPISKNNWANQYADEPKENKLVHSSTYLDVPKEWLGKPFLDEAEHLKEVNPDAYDHEYGGKAIGLGTDIFKFLEIRTITDEEIARQERIYQGQDWGWEPDPKAFIRCSYSHATETIMLLDELGGTCIRTKDMAQQIIDKGYGDYEIRCGVDEPEHINDFKDAGLPARPAIVTPGSVRRTHEWLQCRKIIIDPVRTPRAYKEFTEYEHDVDKNGEVIDGYPDRNNHWIDALRYATSPLSMRRGNSA